MNRVLVKHEDCDEHPRRDLDTNRDFRQSKLTVSAKKLIIGCGYLGQRVAARWRFGGDSVFAVTRSKDRARQFLRRQWQPIVADILKVETLTSLPNADVVVMAVARGRSTTVSIERLYVDGLRNVLRALDPNVNRFVYVSSTGVFGQTNDEWVDEDSPCDPIRPGGKACLAAEELLMNSPFSDRAIILRLAGIYGPRRIPMIQAIQSEQPINVSGNGFLNLIHVVDAASAVVAAEEYGQLGRTYLVSDGNPVSRRDYHQFIATRLGKRLQYGTPDPTAAANERARGSKRIRNDRMIRELNVKLEYPTFRDGILGVLQADE